MNGLPYYKAYPRDFIEGTIGMSFELKGAYRLILDLIYMQGGRLPDDARYISGLLGCTLRKWSSLREELLALGKIEVSNGFLTNYRAEKELETLGKLQDKQRENASRPRKNKGLRKPRLDHTEPDTEIEEPEGSSHKPVRRTSGEFEAWYAVYPHKVQRGAAERAFSKAIKTASLDDLIAGVRRYVAAKPPDRQWQNPATWLNGKGWLDQPGLVFPQNSSHVKPQGGHHGVPTTSDRLRQAAANLRGEGPDGLYPGAGGYDARMLPRAS